MVEDKDEWARLSSALGEALLDLERTFFDVVERQAGLRGPLAVAAAGLPLEPYLDAWSRLDDAHRVLAKFLACQGHPLPQIALRCGQCLQELR